VHIFFTGNRQNCRWHKLLQCYD